MVDERASSRGLFMRLTRGTEHGPPPPQLVAGERGEGDDMV